MSSQTSLWDTPSAISLPESECGVTPCEAPDGETDGLCGPEAARVHPSLRRAKARGLMMLVTSGRRGFGSSASAAL